jgi:hypothetical protein
MTEPHNAVIARLSADFPAISHGRSRQTTVLDGLLSTGGVCGFVPSAPASGAVLAAASAARASPVVPPAAEIASRSPLVAAQAGPGGRVGAIALAATGIAAAYMDVIAVTTIYAWAPAPIGLAVAAVIGGGGLTLLLVGFILALSAASLMVQLGKDWV